MSILLSLDLELRYRQNLSDSKKLSLDAAVIDTEVMDVCHLTLWKRNSDR